MIEKVIPTIGGWNTELFNKKAIVTLKGFVCDIGTIKGWGFTPRELMVSSYTGYAMTGYSIDLDRSIGLGFKVITQEEYDKYKRQFDLCNSTEALRNVCEEIQQSL